MQLTEVLDQRGAADFIAVNVIINKVDPNYIRPLDKDIHEVFDPKKNKAFRFGKAKRWILKDDDGRLIGRIAAFVNKKYKSRVDDGPVGGTGFFDCINDQAAADMLFDVAKHWLLQEGMVAMDGPINFGERDRWWGLLVRGFEPPIYCMNFNPPYYQLLFETYGFRTFFEQHCFAMKVRVKLQDKIYSRHAALDADPDFSARHLDKRQLKKFATDFSTVYNKAWASHGGLKEINPQAAIKLFNSMKPVMDEKVCWYAYYRDEPIAIWINLPDINQWFKYLNGKFDVLRKLKFLLIKKTHPCTKFTGVVFGVVPEFQARGVDSYIIVSGATLLWEKLDYTDYEMQWIGDFNPKMINVAQSLGVYQSRLLITYRYLFDRTKEFRRHPIL
ncbi:MAG TPA: hypothetical protein VGC95_07970 [Chitinophagaceae bacterium]